VILAGGFGTRISEESHLKPKPMLEVGDKPLLWHVMKGYCAQGFNEFVICCGYKGYVIKEYFADYYLHNCDMTFDFRDKRNTMEVHTNLTDSWQVTLVDTGLHTMTGGRLKRVESYVGGNTFMLTYGDGVSDVDVNALLGYHRRQGKLATVTAVRPEGRFGVMEVDGNTVAAFREKSLGDAGWVNGGFMVMEPEIFGRLQDDGTVLEKEPLEGLARDGQLAAYKYEGFWRCMDTQRDKARLEALWASGHAPWKVW
jgi:glucose-1-phosphate cytidylyltransferase